MAGKVRIKANVDPEVLAQAQNNTSTFPRLQSSFKKLVGIIVNDDGKVP